MERLRLATRGSTLALYQANLAARQLSAALPDCKVEIVQVRSSGDADRSLPIERFGRIGVFTAEVDRALLEDEADVAVHSMKDMTTTLQDGIVLATALGRGPAEDVLVSRSGEALANLPAGARVATGSMRRSAMVKAARPDLECVGIRGNVGTRLEKIRSGEADAAILARAGLVRLNLADAITEVLDTGRFVPAVGQGIIGLTCREGDDAMRAALFRIADLEAWHEALAERAFLSTLRGGCNVPVGGHARVIEGSLSMRGRVLDVHGTTSIDGEVSGSRDHAAQLGRTLAEDMLARGADALLAEARA